DAIFSHQAARHASCSLARPAPEARGGHAVSGTNENTNRLLRQYFPAVVSASGGFLPASMSERLTHSRSAVSVRSRSAAKLGEFQRSGGQAELAAVESTAPDRLHGATTRPFSR